MGLPGIGEERSAQILQWAAGNLAHALVGLVDPQIRTPISRAVQTGIRRFLGLPEDITLELKEAG
jgi:hypothetical protein